MKILFIHGRYSNSWEALGIGYLAGYLRKHMSDVELSFAQGCFDSDEAILALAASADIVAFSCTTPTYPHSVALAAQIKAINPSAWIVTGGYHPSAVGRPALAPNIDAIVVGEGEDAMLRIARGDRSPAVQGRMMQFDELAWPDRALIRNERNIAVAFADNGKNITSFQSHRACPFRCLAPDTPIQMLDGTTKRIADLVEGDSVLGVEHDSKKNRWHYRSSIVKKVWRSVKPAYRVTLADGKSAICGPDHRWLTYKRGWKYVTPAIKPEQRPHLTTNNRIHVLGIGGLTGVPTPDYRCGYLAGMIRGDGHFKKQFRLALIDFDALSRVQEYLQFFGIATNRWGFKSPGKPMQAVTVKARDHKQLRGLIEDKPGSLEWLRGWLAGIFDAEGSCSNVLRISNKDQDILLMIEKAFSAFNFHHVRDAVNKLSGVVSIRLRGGWEEITRFFNITAPAISRKFSITGHSPYGSSRVVSIQPLGFEMPMVDIETTTKNFVANGMISHNCKYCLDGANKVLYTNQSWNAKTLVRYRDIDDLLDEIEHVTNVYKLDLLKFSDPTWNTSVEWVEAFCRRKIERGITVPFYPNLHAGMMTQRTAHLMKEAGCYEVAIGVESGSPKVLKQIGKGTTVDSIKRCVGFVKNADILARGYFIVGMPDETHADLEATERLADELGLFEYGFTLLCPYPGTTMFDAEKHRDVDWALADEYSNDFWRNDHMSNAELKAWQARLVARFKKNITFRQREASDAQAA
jgi:radical SAM superfamily enzyme YgiQ (UPF0313 family)